MRSWLLGLGLCSALVGLAACGGCAGRGDRPVTGDSAAEESAGPCRAASVDGPSGAGGRQRADTEAAPPMKDAGAEDSGAGAHGTGASGAGASQSGIAEAERPDAGGSASRAEEPPPPALPAGTLPGVATEVPVRGDRPVRVVHGGPGNRRALVYLHGMCGDPEAMAEWSPLASHYGTLIVLRADIPCGNRPGFKWPQDVRSIQRRIDLALTAVGEQRGGHLERSHLVLVGYSQGAHRAERLAEAYPERYPHLILGGPPGTASPERLAHTRGVAILGGERENTAHMQAGADALQEAGLRSRFFVLPGVGHGGYGPRGPQVLGEVFGWLFD